MSEEIKSGKQILDEFFQEIKNIPDLDQEVVGALIVLYQSEKFSDKNLSNALLALREKAKYE
jgi:hypothetical protein